MSAAINEEQGLMIPEGISVANARLPLAYESAKLALSECSRIDECKDWANKAEALASYARQAEDDTLRKTADRIQARAIRRCGELLKQIEDNNRGRKPKVDICTDTDEEKFGRAPSRITRTEAARSAGLSEHQQKTALRVASVPAEEFESAVESDSPPTVTQLAEQGKKPQPKPLVDLEGRDPEEFAASTKVQGAIRRLYEATESANPAVIARGAFLHEQKTMKERTHALIDWLRALEKKL